MSFPAGAAGARLFGFAFAVLVFSIFSATAFAAETSSEAQVGGAVFAGIFGLFWLFMMSFWIIWLALIVVGLLGMVLWILMLLDCVKRKFDGENEKVVWILVLALTHVIGAVIYYFLVKRRDSKPTEAKPKESG